MPKFSTSARVMMRRLRCFSFSLKAFFSSRLHSAFFSFNSAEALSDTFSSHRAIRKVLIAVKTMKAEYLYPAKA